MWIETLSNGKFKATERYTDYITGKSKKISVTIDKNTRATRKIAEDAIREKIESKNKIFNSDDVTLQALVTAYLKYQETEVKASTKRRNTFACKSIINILGSDSIVSRYSAPFVRQRLTATGRDNATLNEWLTRFKALIRWGYTNDYLDNIKFIDKLDRYKDVTSRSKIEDKFLEIEELELLLTEMKVEIWILFTKFLTLSGLRIGEAIALNLIDLDFDSRIITVSKTYDYVNKVTTSPKTLSSNREVYMQDELQLVCQDLKSYMEKQRMQHGYTDSNLFLLNKKGLCIQYYSYNKYLRENALIAIKRTKVTPHILRHTHTCLLAENGVSLDTISRRLGHEDSNITKDVYFHVTKRMKEFDNLQISKVQIF